MRQSGEGTFEFKVASFGIAAEIALRGRLQSGCILLSLRLKRHNKLGGTVSDNQRLSSARPNNSTGQAVPDQTAKRIVPIGKFTRQPVLILSNPGECGISERYSANTQQKKSLMQSGKGALPHCPLQAPLASCAAQSLLLPREFRASGLLRSSSPNLAQHPFASKNLSSPTSFKSALLSQTSCSLATAPKILIPIFHQKPKNLDRRCFRCLSYSYFIARCRDPVVCWFCRASGHVKKNCKLALQPVNQFRTHHAKATSLEPIVLGPSTSLDVHCPPARDLNSLVSHRSSQATSNSTSQTLSQSLSILGTVRVPTPRSIPSSQNSRTTPESLTSLCHMGDRVRCSLQQNANPNIFDLLAYLA